ncbi:hypothetical protein M5D96_007576, partial [Drosophila gunungcola]
AVAVAVAIARCSGNYISCAHPRATFSTRKRSYRDKGAFLIYRSDRSQPYTAINVTQVGMGKTNLRQR